MLRIPTSFGDHVQMTQSQHLELKALLAELAATVPPGSDLLLILLFRAQTIVDASLGQSNVDRSVRAADLSVANVSRRG